MHSASGKQRYLRFDVVAALFSAAKTIECRVVSIDDLAVIVVQHQPQAIFLEFIYFEWRKILSGQFACVSLGSLVYHAQHGKLMIKFEFGIFRHRLDHFGQFHERLDSVILGQVIEQLLRRLDVGQGMI